MPFGDLRKRVTPWARHLKRRRRFLTRGALGRLVEGLLEDVLGLLERLDLLRARSFAVLVRRVSVDAGVLQVGLVLHSGLELLFVVGEIVGLADELLTLALLASLLHFGILLLLRDGDLRVRHPLLVLIRMLRLVGLGVGLHHREVLRNALEHADDTGALRATLVRRLEELGVRLGQLSLPRRSFDAAHIRFHLVELIGLLLDHASALVELLEDSDGLADCSLRILGVLNRCHVLGLLCLPLLSFVFDLRLHGRNSCHVLLDLHREILNLLREHVDRGLERVPLRLLVLLHHGRGLELLVAPVLVVVLVLLLRHEVEDHLLNHVLDLVKRARPRSLLALERRNLVRKLRQRSRLLRVAGLAEQVDDLRLRVRNLLGDLEQSDTVALRSAHTSHLREDLDGLPHRLNLVGARLRTPLVFLLALMAQLLRLLENGRVRIPSAGRFRERGLGGGQVAALRTLDLRLGILCTACRLNLVLLRSICQLVRARSAGLSRVQILELILELELQRLEHLDDISTLEGVSLLAARAVLELVRIGVTRLLLRRLQDFLILRVGRDEPERLLHRGGLLPAPLEEGRLGRFQRRDGLPNGVDGRLEVGLVVNVERVGLVPLRLHLRLGRAVLLELLAKRRELGLERCNVLRQGLDRRPRNGDRLLILLDRLLLV